jgi:hypothetical protein
MARLDALREGTISEQSDPPSPSGSLSGVDERPPGAAGAGNLSPIHEGTIRREDSELDLVRRGPAVNAAYAMERERRYRERLQAGLSIDQAMSVSDAGTDNGYGEGALVAAKSLPLAKLPKARLVESKRTDLRVRTGPLKTPPRWVGMSADAAPVNDPAFLVPPANDEDPSSPFDMAWTETDTATRASTMISDDPWREEAHENRRRAQEEAAKKTRG